MHVTIHTAALDGDEAPISDAAARTVRMSFNPSRVARVDRLKALMAAFITTCEDMKSDPDCDPREAAVAITLAQQAQMMSVAAATRNL